MSRAKNSSNRLREAPAANQSLPRDTRSLGARISAWRQQHRYSFSSSLGRLIERPWASSLTVAVIGIALALPLLLYVILDNARSLSSGLREARELTVFLKTDQDAQKTQHFATELSQRADVAAVVTRTPEQGLAEFRQLSGFAEALDVLEHNPLPSVLVVTPRAASSVEDPALLRDLKSDHRVDMVQYDAAWRHRLSAILGFGERAMIALMALLGLATLLVVGNTVRMDIQMRAEEIAVVQLMGASDGFVRRPFLYTGLWYGAFGGLLAVLAVGIVELFIAPSLSALLDSYQNRYALHGFAWFDALVVVASGAVLGWIGAWIASTRHLLAGRPQG
jgi:cell division transport system permease protein